MNTNLIKRRNVTGGIQSGIGAGLERYSVDVEVANTVAAPLASAISFIVPFYEEGLISTGQFVPEGFSMFDETIRIVVNEKGEGSIKEDD